MESGGSFRDREDAGRRLAERLAGYRGESLIVFALPRGGVPVGYEIAHALEAPLDIFIARKLGAPGREEFGIRASPFIPHKESVRGFIYEVETGRLREVT